VVVVVAAAAGLTPFDPFDSFDPFDLFGQYKLGLLRPTNLSERLDECHGLASLSAVIVLVFCFVWPFLTTTCDLNIDFFS